LEAHGHFAATLFTGIAGHREIRRLDLDPLERLSTIHGLGDGVGVIVGVGGDLNQMNVFDLRFPGREAQTDRPSAPQSELQPGLVDLAAPPRKTVF
jgi:hypothetical protein